MDSITYSGLLGGDIAGAAARLFLEVNLQRIAVRIAAAEGVVVAVVLGPVGHRRGVSLHLVEPRVDLGPRVDPEAEVEAAVNEGLALHEREIGVAAAQEHELSFFPLPLHAEELFVEDSRALDVADDETQVIEVPHLHRAASAARASSQALRSLSSGCHMWLGLSS